MKENHKYYHHDGFLFNKKLISSIIMLGIIATIAAGIYAILDSPKEFNRGIMPYLGKVIGEQNAKIDVLEARIKLLNAEMHSP